MATKKKTKAERATGARKRAAVAMKKNPPAGTKGQPKSTSFLGLAREIRRSNVRKAAASGNTKKLRAATKELRGGKTRKRG